MKSNCNNCVKKDWCVWSKEYKKEPGQCVEWVGETYLNTTINNFRDKTMKDKYYLMKLPKGLCNGNEVCVELTKEDVETIIDRMQPDFTGFEWDVENEYWTNCSHLQDKIRKILEDK